MKLAFNFNTIFIHELEVGDVRACACIYFAPDKIDVGHGSTLEYLGGLYAVNGSESYLKDLKDKYREAKYKKL